MSWLPEIEELHRRRALAEDCGGPEAVAKHHAQGKLTVRERIAALIDPGSFREVGKLAGKASYDAEGRLTAFEPAPYVMGIARIDGRPVAIGGEDYTIRAGTGFGSDRRKGGQGGFIEDLAYEYRMPLVNLIDGTGGTVNTARRKGYTVVPGYGQDGMERSVDLLGIVPVVSAVMGTTAGGPSMRAILSHWSIMVKGSGQIFAAGPPVVERAFGQRLHKDELGGTRVAVDTAGTIDNVAESEQDCFEQIRRFLSYMPQNVWELPPVVDSGDPVDRCEDALASIVPRSGRQAYNMKKLIGMIVDRGSFFEIQPTFGRAVITGFARMNGKVVGIVASNPMVGGIVDYKAARKQGHFTELCDMFNIPIILFADVPGLMVGVESESDAILREGVRARFIGFQVSVPVFSVLIRKCYGVAGGGFTDRGGLNFKIAWPSAEWGSLPVEGGVKAAYRREIESAPDPAAREKELEAELKRLASPFRTAEAFAVEDIIDPRETRPYLCQFIDALQGRLRSQLGPKFKSGVRP
ncbi:MAG: propionyl-CoA carboxylase [Burkholderiales bacterium]|nr:propionyl-CoA carboxylase [Burkholderiales bacterium]MCW5574563.1 propionyl-CoA carboxylase [Burkholderiales bacterium]